MEKFGVSFGGPGRKELLDTVESQKKQLVQYQTRFRDLVQAYKSLLKEKEALESSLKVLSVSQDLDLDPGPQTGSGTGSSDLDPPPGPQTGSSDLDPPPGPRTGSSDLDRPPGPGSGSSDVPEDAASLHSEDSEDTAASAETRPDPAGETQSEDEPDGVSAAASSWREHQATPPPGVEAERRVLQLRNQLMTLTAALATVTQEKSRMELGFQADRRQLKQEVEELQERLVAAATAQEAELAAARRQLAESRARVITQQHEREEEQRDHAQQLRELQRLLQQERDLRQDAELRLQDAELRLQDAELRLQDASQAVGRGAESQAHLSQVREERDELRRRLQVAVDDGRKPDPRVEQLEAELQESKRQFREQIAMETSRASEVEARGRERAAAAESRASVLELRVSELSELLGSCERQRQRETATTQRLRDRVLQLDTENKTLAMATAAAAAVAEDDARLDVAAPNNPVENVENTAALPEVGGDKVGGDKVGGDKVGGDKAAAAAFYQRELQTLRDEFERYKVRAQSVLKNKNPKDGGGGGGAVRELQEARDQLVELKEKYINLRIQGDEAETLQRRRLDEAAQHAAALQLGHKQQVERLEAEHRDHLQRLEAELHKQRHRTMALLHDKDQELEKLRAATAAATPPLPPLAVAEEAEPDGEGDALSAALWRAAPNEPAMLLYAEQLARKEVEAANLRRHKLRLEEELHQLQARLLADGQRHREEEAELNGRLEKLERDRSREGANMEYLKNVVYRFLTLPDARQHTLAAIVTVLHFSPAERNHVMKVHGASWWAR